MAAKPPNQEEFLGEIESFIEDLQAIRQRVGAGDMLLEEERTLITEARANVSAILTEASER